MLHYLLKTQFRDHKLLHWFSQILINPASHTSAPSVFWRLATCSTCTTLSSTVSLTWPTLLRVKLYPAIPRKVSSFSTPIADNILLLLFCHTLAHWLLTLAIPYWWPTTLRPSIDLSQVHGSWPIALPRGRLSRPLFGCPECSIYLLCCQLRIYQEAGPGNAYLELHLWFKTSYIKV